MNRQQTLLAARGLTDDRDRLLSADEPLAELHECCGGTIPGVLAVPELLDLVNQSRRSGLKIAREFSAFDGVEMVQGFVRVHPISPENGGGCEVLVENWQRTPQPQTSSNEFAERMDAIDRAAAEVSARLDARQQVQFITATAPDTDVLQKAVSAAPSKVWSEYVTLKGIAHHQPLHWRLLDGTLCQIEGSPREWRVRLLPIGKASASPRGFELLMIAEQPLAEAATEPEAPEQRAHSRLIGSALTPVLRQPIARIIANAETVRAKLAGPLREEYSEYAGNIAAAGQHLSGMLDDLADLEVVEAAGFTTAKERVDLADAARRAAGILGVRAQGRETSLVVAGPDDPIIAEGEFRRVLQILINLIGNAIAYSPEGSTVTVAVARADDGRAQISVIDEGSGVSPEQAGKIFDKFERLGRGSNGGADTGSGLGLYISRRLARAMEGDLQVMQPDSADETTGAEFRLTLKAAG
ncbi:HAMP domain-containing sensor histidine kinase [uncultured Erythrobacter sp.]|uniref:sensor histidine kinase n=1 Tax=uncultured Erythrobacter sp. TaxID=263913 RepID=UPI00261B668B|nr:HAMP domain-containing sensor histidine kinase [uncultured Erythrobacter sp.]